jgi:hypothetical protein
MFDDPEIGKQIFGGGGFESRLREWLHPDNDIEWAQPVPTGDQRERAQALVGDPLVNALAAMEPDNRDEAISRVVQAGGEMGRDCRVLERFDAHEWHALMRAGEEKVAQTKDAASLSMIDLTQRMVARHLAALEIDLGT